MNKYLVQIETRTKDFYLDLIDFQTFSKMKKKKIIEMY
jgi:hypothetical protein